ncbi:MAG: cupin-like domain-containing protein [Planctomycetes bacterium]|nr:cupin-like domain-containing protein [Planctomycetota bacterium]
MKTDSNKLFIPPSWKKWIAENVLRDGSPDDLTRVLVENGFPEPLARLEVDAAAVHPYVEAARSLGRQLKKRDWVFDTLRILENEDPSWEVQRREGVSTDEFLDQYYYRNRPVILTDAMRNWAAIQRWTPEYLKQRCGEQNVQIQARRNSNARYEIENRAHESTIRFADYVDSVFQTDATNDFYMTANNACANGQILDTLRDDFDQLPGYLDVSQSDDRMFFWFGPAGTVTPVHHDLTNNFMAQVVGRKQLKLISPLHQPNIYNHLHCYSKVDLDNIDYDEYPQFRNVKIHDVTLHPGELFFLPVGWWHHVRGLDVTITLTCANFRVRNDFASFYESYGEI